MRYLIGGVALLYGVGLPLCCLAVNTFVPRIADPVLEPWRWREIEQLGGQGVLCMDEASDGSLWFGCMGGLIRYDGLTVARIPFDEGLRARIAQDAHRGLWGMSVLCMEDGSLLAMAKTCLVRWEDGTWQVVLPDAGTTSFATRLKQAEDGTIWLLMRDRLWRISKDLSEQRVLIRTSGGQRLSAFCLDGQGDAWVIRNTPQEHSDLVHIPLQNAWPGEDSAWSTHRVTVTRPGSESSICAGLDGKIWYVDNSAQNGAWSFDPREAVWEERPHPESSKGYHSLMRDRNGSLWAGGPGFLYAISGSGDRFYSSSVLGIATVPLSLHEDRRGKWWVIGRGGHVYSMDPTGGQWRTYVGLHFECDAADGKQWFLTANHRVVSHDSATGEWLCYDQTDGTIDWPRSLFCSSHGLVWAPGSHAGRAAVSVFDGETWTRHEHPRVALFLGGGVLEGADGTMWFGAMGDRLTGPSSAVGGALQYEVTDEGKVRLLKHHSSAVLPYTIACFGQAQAETLWVGSPTVYRYDVTSGVTHAVSDLPSVHTHDMVTDKDGRLWVAKGPFGVYRRDQGDSGRFSVEDGLAGTLVVDLLPLRDGTLLAATDSGVSRFDGEIWSNRVFGRDFGMSRSGSMRQSADGAVWFNFSDKDVRSPQVAMNITKEDRFCTVRYEADTLAPDTAIEKHQERVDSSGNIHVSWSGRDPWDNTPPNKLQYSWRIDHDGWSPFSYETGRTFLNLVSGQHTLEVRARDRDLNVDAVPAISRCSVALPVWRRGWFISMVLVMAGGAFGFVWMLVYFHDKRMKERARHLVEVERMKTGFFTNVSHELNTPLGLIRGPLERMMEREHGEETGKLLDMAMRNVDRMSNLVSQILDFRRLEEGKVRIEAVEGDISQCVRECVDQLRPFAERKHVACTLRCDEICTGWFDPEKLERIVSNLVGNAVKYTQAQGRVQVTLRTETDGGGFRTLLLVVEDTGIGVAPRHLSHIFDRFYRVPGRTSVDGSGIGLNLTRELVKTWGGQINAESPIHEDPDCPGIRFTVRLPIALEQISNRGAGHGR